MDRLGGVSVCLCAAMGATMKQDSYFKRNKELILGVMMVAFAIVYLLSTHAITVATSAKVDSRLFPYILGIIIGVIGILQVMDGLKARAAIAKANHEQDVPNVGISDDELKALYPVVGIFILIIAFVLSLQWLGFVIASAACLFLQMMLLSSRNKRKPLFAAAVAIAVSLLIYIAFRKGLDLSLPEGLLDGLM